MKAETPTLHAVLLAGGHSRRMGKNKAALLYQGQTQLARAITLLQDLDIPTSLSLRPGQTVPEAVQMYHIQLIHDLDQYQDIGPLGGILSAFTANPGRSLLVVACDLPFLDNQTLQHLIQNRVPEKLAVAYRSTHDRLPEPLCAIWEPHGEDFIRQKLAENIRCPRKILIQGDTHLLELPSPEALDNINTPEEYTEALERISTRSR